MNPDVSERLLRPLRRRVRRGRGCRRCGSGRGRWFRRAAGPL